MYFVICFLLEIDFLNISSTRKLRFGKNQASG
jgi:hypothetical protein